MALSCLARVPGKPGRVSGMLARGAAVLATVDRGDPELLRWLPVGNIPCSF